jgi:diaminopimelate epimerase/LL-diaminopimelate aminotransferase
MKFTKMQGAGNDYVYINCFEETVKHPEILVEKISDRHKGIGSDGLVLIMPSQVADFRMRMFNPDGSEAQMCGNASRCVGKLVYDYGMTEKTEISLETKAGIKYLKLFPGKTGEIEQVCVDMGEPILSTPEIPVKTSKDKIIDQLVDFGTEQHKITCVSMGNPHTVIFSSEINKLELDIIGKQIEYFRQFPDRTNVEFVEVISPQKAKVRVWERGTGETQACGTGACAVLVAGVLTGVLERKASIVLPGGELQIEWKKEDNHIYMTGDAITVFRGEWRMESEERKNNSPFSTLNSQLNKHYTKIQGSYLFSEIANRVKTFKAAYPEKKVISLGIGDVTQPIAPAVIKAIHQATDEMASATTMRGYAPDQGYSFLIDAILQYDFKHRGVDLSADEIFVSDGAKSDTGNIGDILSPDNKIAITDPAYPVYIDTNKMAGRQIELLPCSPNNGFFPDFPKRAVDVIYLCYPNNPTGTTLTKAQLKIWVDYALQHKALILFDAAYEAFVSETDVPHSIYEIEGAKQVAIEFRSFSKTAGFTGLRCGYTVVPRELICTTNGVQVSLNNLWRRRQSTKFNGTAYIIQRAARAIYTKEGQAQIKETIAYYMENARIIKEGLESIGMTAYGGVNAPYIWAKTPGDISSWEFFDKLLNESQIVTTPGVGFGKSGESFIRLTAFGKRQDTIEAVERMRKGI